MTVARGVDGVEVRSMAIWETRVATGFEGPVATGFEGLVARGSPAWEVERVEEGVPSRSIWEMTLAMGEEEVAVAPART
jgi:hypothetical protein